MPKANAWLRAGTDTLAAQPVRVLGHTQVSGEVTLNVAGLLGPSLANPAQAAEAEAGGSTLGEFFDTSGVSRVRL